MIMCFGERARSPAIRIAKIAAPRLDAAAVLESKLRPSCPQTQSETFMRMAMLDGFAA